jgi:hypothetical protein
MTAGANTGQLQGQIQGNCRGKYRRLCFYVARRPKRERTQLLTLACVAYPWPVGLIASRPGGCPASGVRPDAGQVTTAAW